MAKRRKKKKRKSVDSATAAYRRAIRQADDILTAHGAEVGSDNWQEESVEWFVPDEPERSEMVRYIAQNEQKLGVRWARQILRLEVFFQAEDDEQIIEHYNRALSRYPRFSLIEMWVADMVFRYAGDLWRAVEMYHYAAQHTDHAKARYELGYIHYLLGDFPGAIRWYDQAAERVEDDEVEMAARIFFNRGMTKLAIDGDKHAAIVDIREALRRKPDYVQAKQTLRSLRGRRKWKWVPW
jgi:tetratricopeptide (TPR) repeat protein